MNDLIRLPDKADMPVDSSSLWRWLWFFLKPYRRVYGFFAILRIIRYSIISMPPLAVGLTINAFDSGWARTYPTQFLIAVSLGLIIYGLALVSIIFLAKEGAAEDRMIRGLSLYSVRHINSLPLQWHEQQGSGSKIQQIMKARESLRQFSYIYKWYAVPFVASMLTVLVSVLALHGPWFFYPMFIAFTGTYALVAFYAAKPLSSLHDSHNKVLERLMAGVYEFISSIRTVKAFHIESYIENEARLYENKGHKAWHFVLVAIFRKWGFLNLTGFLWMAAFALTGIDGVYRGWLTTGAFAGLMFLAITLWSRLEEIIYVQDQFIEARNGFMRLTETLKTNSASVDLMPVAPYISSWKHIRFDKVDFIYGGQNVPALHALSLTIGAGEKIALIGPSGAGKSTFIKLLMKQALPERGHILLDDSDLANIPSHEWLSHIGLVPQDVELFNMSIRDNILLDRIGSCDEIVYRAALRQSALEALIDGLPEKDATFIGERGIKLSGGQRQRLGIARALVRQADIIIFDEATSALDSFSEDVIQNALKTFFPRSTMIIIAHRLSTVRFADRIIVLDKGRLVEQGTFDDLLALDGTFSRLWRMQSAGFSEAIL